MSDHDLDATRRAVVVGLALAAAIGRDAAVADEAPFAERYVSFDPPTPLFPISLLDRHGRPAPLAPRRGRICLIALWANWCPACHRDVPRLAAVRPSLTMEGIDVALVNIDPSPPATVLAQAADMSTSTLPLFFDPDGGRLAAPSPEGRRSPFQRFGLPILFVVDGNGFVRGYLRGSVDWTDPNVRAFFHTFGAP